MFGAALAIHESSTSLQNLARSRVFFPLFICLPPKSETTAVLEVYKPNKNKQVNKPTENENRINSLVRSVASPTFSKLHQPCQIFSFDNNKILNS